MPVSAPRAPDPVSYPQVAHAPVARVQRDLDLLGAPPAKDVTLLHEARINLNTGVTAPKSGATHRFDAIA